MNRALPLSRIIVRRAPLQTQQMKMSNVSLVSTLTVFSFLTHPDYSTNSHQVISRTIEKLISKYGPTRTTIGNARSLLHNCKNRADDPYWYTRKII